jgi:hypothetical protein
VGRPIRRRDAGHEVEPQVGVVSELAKHVQQLGPVDDDGDFAPSEHDVGMPRADAFSERLGVQRNRPSFCTFS